MNIKICRFCGEEKSIDNYRHYYDGRKGTYTYCKDCERIETRRKYLQKRGNKCTPEQIKELEDIRALYNARVAKGLSVPGRSQKKPSVASLVEQQLQSINKDLE